MTTELEVAPAAAESEVAPTSPDVPKLRIGLALSGGGFRATLFHLGVIRRLTDLGLLACVRHVCSVSGGSILAGHMACKWESYSRKETFQEAADALIQFTEEGIRQRIMILWPSLWLTSLLFKYNPTRLLTRHYNSLYSGKILESLPSDPVFHILSTSLTNPRQVFCFGKAGCETHPSSRKAYGPGSLKLASAVTASSAFPGMFPPVTLSHKDVGASQEEMQSKYVTLSDGGVFDNLGVFSLRHIDQSSPMDFLIISDASAQTDAEFASTFGREWKYLPRLFDISGQRIYDLDLQNRTPKEILLSIHSHGTKNLGVQTSSQLGKVKTDLDAFSKPIIRALICHGQSVAQMALNDFCQNSPSTIPLEKLTQLRKHLGASSPLPIWEPYTGTPPGMGDLGKEIKTIEEAGTRTHYWKRFVFGMLPYIAIVIAIAWFVLCYFLCREPDTKHYTEKELTDLVYYYWDKNLLPRFAEDFSHHPIDTTGTVYQVSGGKAVFQREQQEGTTNRVITIEMSPRWSLDPDIRQGTNATCKGWIEGISYPTTPSGAVNITISKAAIVPAK